VSETFNEFAEALGGEIGGHLDRTTGRWTCADCDAEGQDYQPNRLGIGLYYHRLVAHAEDPS